MRLINKGIKNTKILLKALNSKKTLRRIICRKRLNSRPPIFHACTSFICEVYA